MLDDLIIKRNIKEEVIAQIGYTVYNSKYFHCVDFLDEETFNRYINKASFIITHAGSGALFSAIKMKKKTIAISRLSKYGEMVDDHQTELTRKLSMDGYILDGTKSLIDAYDRLENFIPRTNDFVCTIEDELLKIFNT